MDVSPVLVADLQAPEAVQPGEPPFDHPGKYCRRHGRAEHLIFNQRRIYSFPRWSMLWLASPFDYSRVFAAIR